MSRSRDDTASASASEPHPPDELLPVVYNELRRLAAARLAKETPGQTLTPTALVHEAYLRLVDSRQEYWDSKGHFFAAAAEATRRILVENARRKKRLKHGGQLLRRDLIEMDLPVDLPSNDLVALDEALTKLAQEDPKLEQLVNLRFFAGLTNAEAAGALGISLRTAERYWTYARAWLHAELSR